MLTNSQKWPQGTDVKVNRLERPLPACSVLTTVLSFFLFLSPSPRPSHNLSHLCHLPYPPCPSLEQGGLQQFPLLGSFPASPPGPAGRLSSGPSPPGGGFLCAPTGEACRTQLTGTVGGVLGGYVGPHSSLHKVSPSFLSPWWFWSLLARPCNKNTQKGPAKWLSK